MSQADFIIDAALSRLLLQAQGEAEAQLSRLPDHKFVSTGQEAADRIHGAVADVAYAALQHRTQARDHDEDHLAGRFFPIARFTGARCEWLDPRLVRNLLHDFGLDEHNHGTLMGALMAQYFVYALRNGEALSGDFGVVVAQSGSGQLSVDLSRARLSA